MTKTTIQLEVTTRKQLAKFGDKGDSYDTIIKELMTEITEYRRLKTK